MDNPGKRHCANCTGTLSFPSKKQSFAYYRRQHSRLPTRRCTPVPTTDSTPPEVSTGTAIIQVVEATNELSA